MYPLGLLRTVLVKRRFCLFRSPFLYLSLKRDYKTQPHDPTNSFKRTHVCCQSDEGRSATIQVLTLPHNNNNEDDKDEDEYELPLLGKRIIMRVSRFEIFRLLDDLYRASALCSVSHRLAYIATTMLVAATELIWQRPANKLRLRLSWRKKERQREPTNCLCSTE